MRIVKINKDAYRIALIKAHMTQGQLAEKLGTTSPAISLNISRGCSEGKLLEIARELNVKPSTLINYVIKGGTKRDK